MEYIKYDIEQFLFNIKQRSLKVYFQNLNEQILCLQQTIWNIK